MADQGAPPDDQRLAGLRAQIDALDRELLGLLNRRAALALAGHAPRRSVQAFRLHRRILLKADLPHQLHGKLMSGRHLMRQHFFETITGLNGISSIQCQWFSVGLGPHKNYRHHRETIDILSQAIAHRNTVQMRYFSAAPQPLPPFHGIAAPAAQTGAGQPAAVPNESRSESRYL